MSKQFTKPFNPIEWPAAPHDFTGDNNLGIYTSETTQRYVYGTRYITWDGRVYKYMKTTTGGCVSYHGVANTLPAQTEWVTAVAADAGARSIVVTDATEVAEDLMAGAMIEVYFQTTADHPVSYHIIGNEAGNATNIKIYLEFPLREALTTSDSLEMFENPYRAVSEATYQYGAWMGIPMVVAATLYNIWAQTWGPALVSPTNTTLDDAAADERTCYWNPNAGIAEYNGAGVTAGMNQIAGYILNAGTAGIAGPQIYLMCST